MLTCLGTCSSLFSTVLFSPPALVVFVRSGVALRNLLLLRPLGELPVWWCLVSIGSSLLVVLGARGRGETSGTSS